MAALDLPNAPGDATLRGMAGEPENLVLEHLRAIRSAVDALREDNREIKTRLGILEQQYASLSSRMDRIEARLDRIERRLELIEA
mgnify:CR=1 FL=1